jgi:hypothetical protein
MLMTSWCSCLVFCLSLLFIYGREQKDINGFFYIYEWDLELHDVYPPPNSTLHPQSSYDHAFYDNRGAGKLLVPELGLFQTWQFSLYKNVLSRLAASRYRTRDPSKADVFIVPFDAGVHSYIDHKNGKPRLASPHGWRAISLLKYYSNNEVILFISRFCLFLYTFVSDNRFIGNIKVIIILSFLVLPSIKWLELV